MNCIWKSEPKISKSKIILKQIKMTFIGFNKIFIANN